jgi:hypothetical protein
MRKFCKRKMEEPSVQREHGELVKRYQPRRKSIELEGPGLGA